MEFWQEEDGIATVELIIILVVLIGVAVLFGQTIIDFVQEQIDKITETKVPE